MPETSITRRGTLAAPLALAAIPAAAGESYASHAAAVRRRIALVIDAFSRNLWIYGGPMPAADRVALTRMDFGALERCDPEALELLDRYGISLDWLWRGDVSPLLNRARLGAAFPIPNAPADPAIRAADRWRGSVMNLREVFDAASPEAAPEGETLATGDYGGALTAVAQARAETFAGLSAQLRAALEGIADLEPGAPLDPAEWAAADFREPDCQEPAAAFRIVWQAIETLDRWAAKADRAGIIAGRAEA